MHVIACVMSGGVYTTIFVYLEARKCDKEFDSQSFV